MKRIGAILIEQCWPVCTLCVCHVLIISFLWHAKHVPYFLYHVQSRARVSCVHVCVQAFLLDVLEEDNFLEKRRKLLRQRAGLSDNDRKKVPLWGICCCATLKGVIPTKTTINHE